MCLPPGKGIYKITHNPWISFTSTLLLIWSTFFAVDTGMIIISLSFVQ